MVNNGQKHNKVIFLKTTYEIVCTVGHIFEKPVSEIKTLYEIGTTWLSRRLKNDRQVIRLNTNSE